MAVKPILQAGIAAQAAGLAGGMAATAKKGAKKKRPSTRPLLEGGFSALVGIPLLQAQSKLVGKL